MTINQISESIGCSYLAANRLVKKLEKDGLLVPATDAKRNVIYDFRKYLEMVDSQVKRNIVRVNATKMGVEGRRGRFSVAFSLPKDDFCGVLVGRRAHPTLPVAFP